MLRCLLIVVLLKNSHGLLHWMVNALGIGRNNTATSKLDDAIVMLLDPDMILLRPMVHDFTNENVLWVDKHQTPATRVVRHGYPIAMQDAYLSNEWMDFNFTHVTQGNAPARPSPKEGPFKWNSGPPYLATMRDFYQMAVLWAEYVPRVLDFYPQIFAGKVSVRVCNCAGAVCVLVDTLSLSDVRSLSVIFFLQRNVWLGHCYIAVESAVYVNIIAGRLRCIDQHSRRLVFY
jgi:hypothetical protein